MASEHDDDDLESSSFVLDDDDYDDDEHDQAIELSHIRSSPKRTSLVPNHLHHHEEEQIETKRGGRRGITNSKDEPSPSPLLRLQTEPTEPNNRNKQNHRPWILLFDWNDPWLPSISVTTFLAVPTLIGSMALLYHLLGRLWVWIPLATHLSIVLAAARMQLFGVEPVVVVGALAVNAVTDTRESEEEEEEEDEGPLPSGATEQSRVFNVEKDVEEEEVEDSTRMHLSSKTSLPTNSPNHLHHQRKTPTPLSSGCFLFKRLVIALASLLDIVLFGYAYPQLWKLLNQIVFTEFDGTTVVEWTREQQSVQVLQLLGYKVVVMRLLWGVVRIGSACTKCCGGGSPTRNNNSTSCCCDPCGRWCILLRTLSAACYAATCGRRVIPWKAHTVRRIQNTLRRILNVACLAAVLVLSSCLYSAIIHWLVWPEPISMNTSLTTALSTATTADATNVTALGCDPLDETECSLPFPSFHFMRRDSSTETGWRVNLQGKLLPLLKGGIPMDPHFLNELDGFSTMGPILFYLEGMKEAHEADLSGTRTPRLQGPANLADSLTSQSITLLLDVNASALIAHSAEIDYLDPINPLVLIFPAQPLQHNNHYAVAVINATDGNGDRILPTPGMQALFDPGSNIFAMESDRRERYQTQVFPVLQQAVPWLAASFSREGTPPDSLQLLFDFVTVSETSQLGPVRHVRDAALAHIVNDWNGDWSPHVRVNRLIEQSEKCDSNDGQSSDLARIVHAELDVPWFLTGFGPGQRAAFLDADAVRYSQPTTIGVAKFMVGIPCSARAAALGLSGGKPIRAIMEYGHGLFFTREEALDRFLLQMANDEGYAITAMDWRGMSAYDLPYVAKTLLSKPRLFQAVRDNLIQGYANKYALQHFSQNGMLSTGWFDFASSYTSDTRRVPTLDNQPPVPVFYGNSQGGILGAGYAALSGATGLIKRAVLGVPGTPFALIMTRSLDFTGYDKLLLLNFYNNRNVRIFLAMAQMGWDSLEGSGVLATPVKEPIPPILMQAGLGDAVVPTIAAEALARGFNASILSSNPRSSIYGVSQKVPGKQQELTPQATLTELMYQTEDASLPMDDNFPPKNYVHVCVRRDKMMIKQVSEFINSGHVIDPCEQDGCKRLTARCW